MSNTALAEALREIARQKKTDELETEHDVECADFEGGYDACIDTARAALAAYDAAPGLKVKPLEWEEFDAWTYWAKSPVGMYRVEERNGAWKTTRDAIKSVELVYEYTTDGLTPEDWQAAKSAAQADYESRILAALAPAASPAPDLSDPNTVHLNMLRGTIAKPSVDQIIHIYGIDALCKALAPQIVREAEEAAPAPSDDFAAGMRQAAKIIAARREAYQAEYGHYDPTTGMTEYPGNGDEWIEEWVDCEDAILAAIPAAGAWEPPADRPFNFECLGWVYGGWDFVFWNGDHWVTRKGNRCHPTAFAPLPPAPAGEGEG